MGGILARRALPGLSALAGLALSSALQAAPPPAALFAAEPEYRVVAISPHGTRIVRTGLYKDPQTLIGIDVAQRRSTPLLSVDSDEYSVSSCRFKSEDYIVCSARVTDFINGRPFPVTRIFSLKYDDPKPRILIRTASLAESQFHDIIDWMPRDPTHVLVEVSDDGSIYPAVYSVDVASGGRSRVLYAREPILSWMTDGDGVVRFGSGYDSHRRVTYLTRTRADEPWRELMKASAFASPFAALGFGPTPNTLLVSADHHGRDAIFELDLRDTKDLQLVFAHPSVDVGGPIVWPTDQRIVGFWFDTERPQVDLFDSTALLVQRTLDQALPGTANSVVSATDDGKRLVVSAISDVKPTTYYLLDRDARTMLRLGSEYPGLESFAGAYAPRQIAAENGITLPGTSAFLRVDGRTCPPSCSTGGHMRAQLGLDMRQFLVSRGYAVVQVNFAATSYGSGGTRQVCETGAPSWSTTSARLRVGPSHKASPIRRTCAS
jgi:dipeptidyl aminopeptidase/acylaminoacyl peptidase